MPAPAILGIPTLAAFASSLVATFFAYIIKYVQRRFMVIALFVTLMAVAIKAFVNYVADILGGLFDAIPQLAFVPYFVPSSLSYCLSVIVGLELTITLYRVSTRFNRDKSYMLA